MSLGLDKAGDLKKSASWNSATVSAEKMQRLDRLANLGMLSAGMAHEIKNGMVAIKTFVDLLLEKNQDAELGEVVRHELKRINAIATQMLRIAAPNHAAFQTVRIHEVLDHSLRLLRPQISVKLIALKKHYRAGADTVLGDDAQLQQVFMNLLLNALEAMGPNGTLTVSTEMAGSEKGGRVLKIQIQDTGVGIKPENVNRLFEPFFTTKKNGTGLGLAISHRIVLEHRGTIQVRSEPGKSSVFSLSLPVLDA
ncbi:MAG: ATP-binding protein [Verrucomicrobiales bacterium]|nr:ATP-binding protein [Verrucomicrobiales bacterium]